MTKNNSKTMSSKQAVTNSLAAKLFIPNRSPVKLFMSNSFRCKLLHTKQFGTQTVHDQLSQRRCAARSRLGPAGGRRQRPAHVTAATNSPTRKQVSHHVWHLNSVSEQSRCQTVCCQQFGAEPVRCQLFRQQTVCYKAFGIQPVHFQLFNQQTVC